MVNMYEKALKFALEAKEKRNKKMKKAGTYMSVLFPYDEFHFDFGRRTGKTSFIKTYAETNKEKSIIIIVPNEDYIKSYDEIIDFVKVYKVSDIELLLGIDKIDILLVDDASDIDNLKSLISRISHKLTNESMIIKIG